MLWFHAEIITVRLLPIDCGSTASAIGVDTEVVPLLVVRRECGVPVPGIRTSNLPLPRQCNTVLAVIVNVSVTILSNTVTGITLPAVTASLRTAPTDSV